MDEDLHELKEAINNFLWMHLPPNTTIGAADAVALSWYEQLKELHHKAARPVEQVEYVRGGRFA